MRVPNLAIVGSESLLGKEILQLIRDRTLAFHVRHVGAEEEDAGRITSDEDEAVVITPLDETNLTSADAVILAGSSTSSNLAWRILGRRPEVQVIDVTRSLEDVPAARLVAPSLHAAAGNPAVIAHPAAIALAEFYSKLEEFRIRRSVVHIFEPASERGQSGIDELHQQTMKLFAFQPLPQQVYDTQIAFNMLARLGPEATLSLEQVEQGIERHLVSLMGGRQAPMPSLRLVQAPVFHGYSYSLWVEFEPFISKENLSMALFAEEDPPTNAGVAGENGISVGGIRQDPNQSRAYWFWMVIDNLRVAAENAVQVLEQSCRV